jgi:hypothetical protein
MTIFDENKKMTVIATANITAVITNSQLPKANVLIMEEPPKMYADSSAKFSNFIKMSPTLADILHP